ncbi:hypothetical protein [Nocardia africana]
MSLINIPAPPNVTDETFTILASTVGDHFAVYPSVSVGADGELRLDTEVWVLHHRPSGMVAFELFQSDPMEFPGEPRAIDMRSVRRFVQWLESRIDCSTPDVDFTTLSAEDRKHISWFRSEPNHYNPEVGLA